MRCDTAIEGVLTSIVIDDLWEIAVGYCGNLAILMLIADEDCRHEAVLRGPHCGAFCSKA